MLVVTRDVWSLRLNSDFRFEGGRLRWLRLEPSENNLGPSETGNRCLYPRPGAIDPSPPLSGPQFVRPDGP